MGNVMADRLLAHVYRWVISHQAAQYDPALHRLVSTMMKKVCRRPSRRAPSPWCPSPGLLALLRQVYMQLLAEFKRLGAGVVYASLNTIILSTTKTTAPEAHAYIDYVLKSIMYVGSIDQPAVEIRDLQAFKQAQGSV